MKKLLLALAIVSTSVFAQEKTKVDIVKGDTCGNTEKMARAIIGYRYKGLPARKMIEIMGDNAALKIMIIDAYKEPSYSTQSVINKTINEFADKWYLICLEAQDK